MEHTLFTNRWYAVRPSKSVRRKPVEVDVLGNNAVLWRNKDNSLVMQRNACPHRGAKLSMGKVNSKRQCIECPYHGWAFDDSGILRDVPSCDTKLIDTLQIDTWNTMESGGLVWFCLGNPHGYSPPVIKEMHSKAWTCVNGFDVFHNDWITTLENSIDVTHVNFVHSDFGDSQNGSVKDVELVVKSTDHIRMLSTICHKSDNIFLKFTEKPDVRVKHDVLLPNTVSIQFWIQDVLNVITYVTYTPLGENRTLVNWAFLRNPRFPIVDSLLDWCFVDGMVRALREDKRIVDSLKNPAQRVSVPPDNVQNKFRRMLHEMKMQEPTTKYT